MVCSRFTFVMIFYVYYHGSSSPCICVPIMHRFEPCRGFWHPPWEPLQLLIQIFKKRRRPNSCNALEAWNPACRQARHEDYEGSWRGWEPHCSGQPKREFSNIVSLCQCCLRRSELGQGSCPECKIHRGFYKSWQSLESQTIEALKELKCTMGAYGSRNKAEPIQNHIVKHIVWNIVEHFCGKFCEDLWSVTTSWLSLKMSISWMLSLKCDA